MFLSTRYSGINRDGEQSAGGPFLLIFNQESGGELRAIVRYARMRQCGHWMMGSVKVGDQKVCLSGDYGGDGLPISNQEQTAALWDRLHPLPPTLAALFWKGGGHNCAGREAQSIRAWARLHAEALKELRPVEEPAGPFIGTCTYRDGLTDTWQFATAEEARMWLAETKYNNRLGGFRWKAAIRPAKPGEVDVELLTRQKQAMAEKASEIIAKVAAQPA
jgi:hypothetical protein